MTKATTNVARVAAAVAGLGLVASSFAPLAAFAQTATTTSTTTTTTTAATFSRDLTLGSTGADVTALQTWLISKGYGIAAGATGYFGAQTKAALAAYQAANAISPAAGYFGPITRAKVMAGGTTTSTNLPAGCTSTAGYSTTTGKKCSGSSSSSNNDNDDNDDDDNDDSDLSGGEADLRDFDLRSEDSEGSEGEDKVKAATAEFDVDNGDAMIERAELTLHARVTSDDEKPWNYIDKVRVWNDDGDEIASMDADNRDDWDEEDSDEFTGGSDEQYTLDFSELDEVVREGDEARLTFTFDINDSIDTEDLDQVFELAVLDDGIRAIDSEDVDQFTGNDSDHVNFGFSEEENGELSVRESDEDPDSTNLKVEDDETSDEFKVFTFEIRNTEDEDTLVTDLDLDVNFSSTTADLNNVINRATLMVDGDEYDADINDEVGSSTTGVFEGNLSFDDLDVKIEGDKTMKFELEVRFAAQTATNYPNNATISFAVDTASIEAEGDESGDDIDADEINGAADSNVHTLSLTGFEVEPVSTSQSVTTTDPIASSFGTFTIKFDVTADEDDQVFIDDTAAAAASSTVGATFNVLTNNGSTTLTTATLTSNADMQGGTYRVDAGDTEQFTLTVTIDPATAGQYRIELERVNYGTTPSAPYAQGLDVDNNDSDFETDNVFIPS